MKFQKGLVSLFLTLTLSPALAGTDEDFQINWSDVQTERTAIVERLDLLETEKQTNPAVMEEILSLRERLSFLISKGAEMVQLSQQKFSKPSLEKQDGEQTSEIRMFLGRYEASRLFLGRLLDNTLEQL